MQLKFKYKNNSLYSELYIFAPISLKKHPQKLHSPPTNKRSQNHTQAQERLSFRQLNIHPYQPALHAKTGALAISYAN